jgi:hypothetical protein
MFKLGIKLAANHKIKKVLLLISGLSGYIGTSDENYYRFYFFPLLMFFFYYVLALKLTIINAFISNW